LAGAPDTCTRRFAAVEPSFVLLTKLTFPWPVPDNVPLKRVAPATFCTALVAAPAPFTAPAVMPDACTAFDAAGIAAMALPIKLDAIMRFCSKTSIECGDKKRDIASSVSSAHQNKVNQECR